MRKTRLTEEQSVGILRLVEAGQSAAEVCRRHGVSQGTYERWTAPDGGMPVSQLQHLRQLEDENRRLQQIVADLTRDNVALKDVLRKKA